MPRVFAYLRKSTDDNKKQQNSLQYQRAEIARMFGNQYGEIQFFEASESAAKQGREVFDRLVKEIKDALKYDEQPILLSHAVDRLTRNLYDLAKLNELREQGLIIRTCSGDYQGSDALITLSIQGVFAADQINKMKTKMQAAYKRAAKEQGKWFFGVPMGYMAGKVKGIREPHPVKSVGVKRIFKEFLEHSGSVSSFFPRALKIAEAYGVRLKARQNLHYILKNRFYIGKIHFQGTEYDGAHVPIVDRGTFAAVQELMAGRRHIKVKKHEFVFKGHIRCKCGKILTGEIRKGHVYYRCHNRDCDFKNFKQRDLIDFMQRFLLVHDLNPEKLPKRLQELKEEKTKKLAEKRNDRAAVQRRISNLEYRLEKLTDDLLDGKIESETYNKLETRVHEKISVLRSQRNKMEQEMVLVLKKVEEFFGLMKDRVIKWLNGTDQEKRWILHLLGSDGIVTDDNRLQMRLFEFFDELGKPKNSKWLPQLDKLRTEVQIFLSRYRSFEREFLRKPCTDITVQ